MQLSRDGKRGSDRAMRPQVARGAKTRRPGAGAGVGGGLSPGERGESWEMEVQAAP